MNNIFTDENNTSVDFLEAPADIQPEVKAFSMKAKRDEFLGMAGKPKEDRKDDVSSQPENAIDTSQKEYRQSRHQTSLTGKELPSNWPLIASPEEEAKRYNALRDEGEDLAQPPKHHHIDRLSYTLKNGTKELRYLAVQHIFGTENKTHPQFAALKENFDRHKPQVVLYEGQKIHENSQITEEGAYRHGEKAYMQYLVQEHNKNLKPGEEPIALEPADIPNEDEPAEYRRRGYSNEEIAANEVLKSMHYDASNIQNTSGLTDEQKAQKIHELQTKYNENPIATIRPDFFSWVPRADGQPWTAELIKQEIEKQTGQAIKVDIDHLSFPQFRQMFDAQREFRDQHIVRKIAEASQKYDRVMAVMGSGHTIRDKQALEQYFDVDTATQNNEGYHLDSFVENSQLREDRLVDENEGYQLVSSHIKNGEIVLMGDLHGKKKTHELFLNYMDKLSSDGLPFSLALELPSQLTEKIIDKSPEEIIEMTSEIYRNNKEVFSNFFAEDILPILKLAKDRSIKILCIDEEQSGIKDKNELMASQLKKARQSGVQAILTMVGRQHAQAIAIPKYIDAFSVHMGEDKAFLGKKSFNPGMFDTQIEIAGDNSIFS